MRADHNWEDEIGKRLRDHEAMPPPLAWNKIRQDIRPRRQYRWWLWLPVLLVLLGSLPLAYHHFDFLKPENSISQFRQPASGQPAASQKTGSPALVPPAASPQQAPAPAAPAHPEAATVASTEQPVPGNPYAANGAGPNRVPVAVLPAARPDKKHPDKISGLPAATLAEEAGTTKSITVTSAGTEADKVSRKVLDEKLLAVAARKKPESTQARQTDQTPETDQATGNTITANRTGSHQANGTIGTPPATPETATETAKATGNLAGVGVDKAGEATENAPAGNTVAGNEAATITAVPGLDSAANVMLAENQLPAKDSAAKTEKNKPEESKSNKWAVSVYGAPQFAFQRVRANTEDDIMLLRLNNRNQLSRKRLGYDLGFRGHYQLTELFGLEAGLHAAGLKQNVSFTVAGPGADSVVISQGSNGQLSMQLYNREQEQEYTSKHFMGGIYLGGTYAVFDRLLLTGGAGTNWLISTEANRSELASKEGKINPYLAAGLRYELPVGQKYTLQAGPVAQYYLRSMQEKNAFFGVKPVTFGLLIGLKIASEK